MSIGTANNHQARVAVSGMHCAACSSRIEKVVGNMEGVERASVNLAAEMLDLSWNEDAVTYIEIQEQVSRLGFELEPLKSPSSNVLEFSIGGMHCAACSSRIERVVGSLPGVVSAEVNLATETARFIADKSQAGVRNIRMAIEGLGFTAQIRGDKNREFEQKREETRARLAGMKKRLLTMLLLAMPLLYISMGEMVGLVLPSFLRPHAHPLTFAITQFIIVLPIVWLGRSFYIVGIPALLRRVPNMDSLIAVGTGAALIYSCWNLVEIALGIEPMSRVMDLYFESAGILIALVSLGKYMETRSKSHTSDAISQLLELSPETATLLEGDEQREISVDEIEKGDLLLVKPGERIPVDGIIHEGQSSIDESMLTGESMPVTKKEAENVYGGTLNKNNVLKIICKQTGEDTVLSRIVRMVQEAQGSKAPIAGMADRISLYFVPAVMAFALITGLAWYFIGNVGFTVALRFFIAVLVIACPCAMGLATPTSLMVGTGRGAQLGVLIKNGAALEMSEKVDVIIFDKTGTLTRGKPELTDVIITAGDLAEAEILLLAGSAELSSEHPLGEAVVMSAREKGIKLVQPERFMPTAGKGISAVVNGKTVFIGNKEHTACQGLDLSLHDQKVQNLSQTGKTVLYMVVDNVIVALLAVADTLKPESRAAVARLQKLGKRLIMLTGDQKLTAQAIADEAGIREIIAEVMPEDKAKTVKQFQSQGLKVAMVGDGINDAPALAQADVGIAMGTGIDIAIESGDIVIMKGNLDGIYNALMLSGAVMRNIRQNLFWAFAFNVTGIPVAAGILYVFGGPALNPMLAGAAMAMSSVTVVTNALRLRFFSVA
jgi:Cu+-exporting ATPase